jgi:aryl-alcohol dehydrogenase-like predicted oxidoreductase
MQRQKLGKTDLVVTRLGVGLGEIGRELTLLDEDQAALVLNWALDSGVNFFDTAACYGFAEELIGRTVADRRHEFVLATKAGHVVEGYEGEPWTAVTIRDSIDRSLERMQTDYVDLLQLHSCSVEILERGEVIQALQDAQRAGKARYIGYSGDGAAAQWAIESGVFDALQTSFNLVDQRARKELFPNARAKGMGIIAKRPIANGVWGQPVGPSETTAEYHHWARQMAAMGPIPGAPDEPVALALGFTLAHEEVDTAIVGTSDPTHMRDNIDYVETLLPIPAEAVRELRRRFDVLSQEWRGE